MLYSATSHGRRRLACWVLLLFGCGSGAALADDSAAPDPVVGLWQTVDDETRQPKSLVELYLDKDRLYGRIVKLFRQPGEHPDPVCKACRGALKNAKIVGMTIVDGLRWDGETWSKGTILDPAEGKTYDCKIWRDGELLKVRGYLGIFFRTQTWLPGG